MTQGQQDQTISAGGGVGELHRLSIEKPDGSVTFADEIEISGSYADNGTVVDATGAKIELQGSPSISAGSTTFGDLELNASTVTIDGDLWVHGDLTVSHLYRLEGGIIHVAGTIDVTDGTWSGFGEIVPWSQESNEELTDLAFSGGSVAENAPAGTVVGTASASDPDSGETFTYELTGNAGGRFEIDPDTGVVTVADGAVLDFEDSDSHTVTVKVIDSAGHAREVSHSIELADQLDTPELDEPQRREGGDGASEFVTEQSKAEENIVDQIDRAEELIVEELNAEARAPAGVFTPVVDVPEFSQQEARDWSLTEFGEIIPAGEIDGDFGDSGAAGESAHTLATDDHSTLEDGDLIQAPEIYKKPGVLAKLWGFARAYRGASDSSSATRQQRS